MVSNLDTNTVSSSHTRKGLVGGAILILIGLMTLFNQFGFTYMGEFFLALTGAIFVIGAFASRKRGLLIPGGILLGLNGAILLQNIFQISLTGGIFLMVFAGGFLLITVLSAVLNRYDPGSKIMYWPLVPGAIIGFVGGLLMSGETGLYILQLLNWGWPIILILLGLWVIFRRR